MPEILRRGLPDSLPSNLERLAYLSLALAISTVSLGIAPSGIFLAAAIVGAVWIYLRKNGGIPGIDAIGPPLLCFFWWTLAAALVSPHRLQDLLIARKFYIFLLLLLVPYLGRGKGRILWIYHAVFLVSAFTSCLGLVQFALYPHRTLLDRIRGLMSTWMTYSELQMFAAVMLCAYAFCIGVNRRRWVLLLGVLLLGSLGFSLTRSAWLGATVGLTAILALKRPRAIPVLLILLTLIVALGPSMFRRRLLSGLNATDRTTRGRIELFETSIRLIRDNPWFGVGPKSVNTEALRYRGSREFLDWEYQHMHNNFLQIAAERGLPGLLFWLWFMARLGWDSLRLCRGFNRNAAASEEADLAATGALGAWAALLVAGLFEYNFGDAEPLTLFLFIMSAPYAFLKKDANP